MTETGAGTGRWRFHPAVSHQLGWYQNIRAAGGCVITYQGADHTVTAPIIVDRATAGPAYPRYERLALALIGINEFLLLTDATAH
jgi:hypothetical protein